jgi:urease accessory protein
MLHVPPHELIRHQRASGRGECFVKSRDGKSVIDRLWQQGCSKLRLPKAANGDFEVVMINSSGGLTGGDRLDWAFTAADNCTMTITTQACEKVYASLGGPAHVDTEISVGANGHINWLPQETILFNEAELSRKLEVNLAFAATALLVEPVLLGRLAMNETLLTGQIHDQWNIFQNGQLIHAERFILGPDVERCRAQSAVLKGAQAYATVLLVDPLAEQLLDKARAIIGDQGGASFWNGKLLARVVDDDGYQLRKRLMPLVSLLNKQAALPKCWSI